MLESSEKTKQQKKKKLAQLDLLAVKRPCCVWDAILQRLVTVSLHVRELTVTPSASQSFFSES